MSASSNKSSANSDRRSFSEFLKSNIYGILSHIGMTLFVIVSSYLLLLLSSYDQQNDLFFLIGLAAILLFLAYFVLCTILGLLLPVITSKVTHQNFSGCWLILLLMSAGVAILGFLMQEGQILFTSPPAFIAPLLSALDVFVAPFGIYLMLYGGGAFLCYIYFATSRMCWPSAMLKTLLGNIIILAVVCWSTHNAWVNEDDPYLLSLACFVIQFLGLAAALVFGCTKTYTFARSCRGRVKAAFVPLYLFNGVMAVAGILLLLGSFGVHNLFKDLLDFLLQKMPDEIAEQMEEYASILSHDFLQLFMGICLLLLHGGSILGTVVTQLEKCKYCGRYACEKSTDTDESSKVTGIQRVTEKETFLTFDKYGYNEDIYTTTNDYKTVSGKTHYDVHCAYCGKYLFSSSHKWTHTFKTDSNIKKESHYHPWSS